MEQRLWIPDYIKGWAILFMIQDHIFETWINQDILFTPAGSVIRFINNVPAAALFMLIMGYFAACTKASSKRLVFRGLKVFLWGFLLNAGLNMHYIIRILTGSLQGSILESLFAVDIFYLAGLSLVILGLIKTTSIPTFFMLLGSIAIVAFSPGLTNCFESFESEGYVLPFIAKPSSWSFFPIFPWLAYPLTGFAFAKIVSNLDLSRIKSTIYWIVLCAAMAIGSLGFIYNWNDLANLTEYYHHGPLVYMWILGFSLSIVMILLRIPQIRLGGFSAWILFMGKSLTRIYVIQWLIIGNLATLFFQQLGLMEFLIGFILITALSTLIVFLLKQKQLAL